MIPSQGGNLALQRIATPAADGGNSENCGAYRCVIHATLQEHCFYAMRYAAVTPARALPDARLLGSGRWWSRCVKAKETVMTKYLTKTGAKAALLAVGLLAGGAMFTPHHASAAQDEEITVMAPRGVYRQQVGRS